MPSDLLETVQGQPEPQGGIRRRIGGAVAVLAVGDIVNKGARFCAVVVLTHALPLDEYGRLNLGVALGGIALVLTRLGLPDLGAREAAIAARGREELAARIVTPQVVGLLLLTALACAVTLVLTPGTAPLVALGGASTLGLALSGDWMLRGMDRMLQVSLAIVLSGFVALAGAVVVAVTARSATAGLVALAIGELAGAAWTWRSVNLRRVPRATLAGLAGMLRESWPLAISGAVTYAYLANIDTILLAATRSTREAGLYSAPYRLFLALNTTGIFAGYALLPLVARAVRRQAAEEAQRLVLSCLSPLAGLGLLWLGLAGLFGGRLLDTLFGAPFAAMATTFTILCAALPWYAIGYPVGYSAIASGHPRRLLAGAAVAAVLNIVLNLLLIPPMGPQGAAIATTAAIAAAGLTWLASQRLLARVIPLVGVVALSTAAACVASLTGRFRAGAAAGSLAVGVGLLVVGGAGSLKRLLSERSSG